MFDGPEYTWAAYTCVVSETRRVAVRLQASSRFCIDCEIYALNLDECLILAHFGVDRLEVLVLPGT